MTETAQIPAASEEIHRAISQKAAATLGNRVDGNGLKAEQVRLTRQETVIHHIPGALTVKLKPEIAQSHLKGRNPRGQILGQSAEAPFQAEGAIQGFFESSDVQQEILAGLAKMPEHGFGAEPGIFPLHLAKKEFCAIETCGRCNGATFFPCAQCNSMGAMPCLTCSGHGFMQCQTCFGTGQMQQGNARVPCPRCQMTGRTLCLTCSGQKQLPCTLCRGTGRNACMECDQSGFLTYIFHAAYKTEYIFDLDREIPADVRQIIETLGIKQLASENHAEIIRHPPEIQPGLMLVPFTAFLPVAEVEFSVEGKPYPATVAGLQGRIIEIDPLLDKFIKPGIAALMKLSKGPMASQALIDTACKYRLIRDALGNLVRHRKKISYQKLVKDYPLILSDKYAKATILYADKALLSLSKGPRNKGLLAGTLLALLLAAGYFMSPLRGRILALLTEKNAAQHMILSDIAVWIMGYALALYTIKFIAAQAFRKLLPGSVQAHKKGLPSAGAQGLWAWGTTFAAWCTAAGVSPEKPQWMASFLQSLGI